MIKPFRNEGLYYYFGYTLERVTEFTFVALYISQLSDYMTFIIGRCFVVV